MYLIGVDLGGTKTAVGVVDGRGEIIAKASAPTGAHDPESIAENCKRRAHFRKKCTPRNGGGAGHLHGGVIEYMYKYCKPRRSEVSICSIRSNSAQICAVCAKTPT